MVAERVSAPAEFAFRRRGLIPPRGNAPRAPRFFFWCWRVYWRARGVSPSGGVHGCPDTVQDSVLYPLDKEEENARRLAMRSAFELNNWIDGMKIAEPIERNGLQVFGVRHAHDSSFSYLTLDEALRSDRFTVTEVDEGGEVPTLKVANKSDSMVFLMAGEELIGAKQNRVLNISLMVGADSEVAVPVSCVEAGRWGYRSRKFSSAGTSSHSLLRKMMSAQVAGSYRKRGTPSSARGRSGTRWRASSHAWTRPPTPRLSTRCMRTTTSPSRK